MGKDACLDELPVNTQWETVDTQLNCYWKCLTEHFNQKGCYYTTRQSQWTGFPTYLHNWILVLNAGQNLFMSPEIHACMQMAHTGTQTSETLLQLIANDFHIGQSGLFPLFFTGADSDALCLHTKQELG